MTFISIYIIANQISYYDITIFNACFRPPTDQKCAGCRHIDSSSFIVHHLCKMSLCLVKYISNKSTPNFGRILNSIKISLVGWAPSRVYHAKNSSDQCKEAEISLLNVERINMIQRQMHAVLLLFRQLQKVGIYDRLVHSPWSDPFSLHKGISNICGAMWDVEECIRLCFCMSHKYFKDAKAMQINRVLKLS